MSIDIIPELTEYIVAATFRDAAGDPTTPSAASYRLVDASTGTDIIPSTPLVITGPSVTITIPANKNTCQTPLTRTEYKQLVITSVDMAQVEHLYRVARVPAP
ncbi:MAG: hypothetical protein JZU65_23745 [Chlorobium sp.]|nr:hypothetical protein [Chlorobium sp.]